jgi:hypothetical protein
LSLLIPASLAAPATHVPRTGEQDQTRFNANEQQVRSEARTCSALPAHWAPGGSELGLFVTLGAYSMDKHEERRRQNLRLINGTELVNLIFDHYEKFSPEFKRLLPMRSVYVVDHPVDMS